MSASEMLSQSGEPSIVTLLIGAGGVVGQLQEALNTIWEVEAKPGGEVLWHGLEFLVSLGLITLLFALIYKVLPDV
jgi:membrane protein